MRSHIAAEIREIERLKKAAATELADALRDLMHDVTGAGPAEIDAIAQALNTPIVGTAVAAAYAKAMK